MPNSQELAQQFSQKMSRWPKGRLPSVRTLAAQHGASTRTVQEALQILCVQGLVESHPRSGMWRSGEYQSPKFAPTRLHVEELSARLQQEIADGLHLWDSPLPLIKELAVRWSCHEQTASKVMERAIHAGYLERKGRFHFPRLPQLQRKKSVPTILCLGAGAADGHFRMDSDRESDFWREMGAQAALAGLSLVRRVWEGGRVKLEDNTVGVIATNWHYPDPMAICLAISRLKVPTCVWFDEHNLDATSMDARIHFHDQGHSAENGALLARHLLELGHQRIAFISPWHANSWSLKRFQGIAEEVAHGGGIVDLCCLYGDSEWDRLLPAENDPLFVKTFPAKIIAKIVEGPSEPIRDIMTATLGWNRIRQDMAPLFEKALASGATAWIGANDVCALNALRWLRQREVAVPQRVAVAGFDDTVEALRSDLTSFRFSCASVARAMIYQILSGSTTSTLTRHKGSVVARATTARKRERA